MVTSQVTNRERGVNAAGAGTVNVRPIPFTVAKELIIRQHYLRSFPGGTKLTLGVFSGSSLVGVIALGVGPYLAYQLVEGATPDDCLCLSRFWLADDLPRNSESHVLGMVIRALKRHTEVKFLVAYSDPSAGHTGVIYQATNWLYTGLSAATPLYDIGGGIARHSRSLAHEYGSHSLRHFAAQGVGVKLVLQAPKHRYVCFLDPAWRCQLRMPVQPYPRAEVPRARR